jgi:hypothetical protein
MMVISIMIKTQCTVQLFNFRSKSYVSKRANDESEFWKSGKDAYNNDNLKEEIIFATNNRVDHKQ